MTMRWFSWFLLILLSYGSAQAAHRELTYFSDGTLVELDATAKKGVAEVTLPGQIREGTLRVKPLDNGSVGLVELLPVRMPDKLQKELDSLLEQKSRLQDRMKALDHREGIFAAAAKSQSSKAPRKTKTNPDPLSSVRQGTDFAITQLEAVYTARRKTEQELKRVEARLEGLHAKASAGPTVKVVVSPATARIRVAAVLKDGGWSPRYELRLQGSGTALLALLADINRAPEGYTVKVATTPLAEGARHQTYPLPSGVVPRLAEWQLPVEKELVTSGPLPTFSLVLKNTTAINLPAGQAALYSNGEYLGTTRFTGLAPGTSSSLSGPGHQKAGSP